MKLLVRAVGWIFDVLLLLALTGFLVALTLHHGRHLSVGVLGAALLVLNLSVGLPAVLWRGRRRTSPGSLDQ